MTMNPNSEYEKFTQEVYQGLVDADTVKTTVVKHNVKLLGKSGQEHQIDVYWEYEIAGVFQKVAIECKNYNKEVPIGKVRDFYGVLSDLNNVAGIMVTKVGYQQGAKKFAAHHGITLKELRTPNRGEGIIGEIKLTFNIAIRHCLFVVDEKWAESHGIDLQGYRQFLDNLNNMRWPPRETELKWRNATHIPLETRDSKIRDGKGQIIATLEELEDKLPDNFEEKSEHTFEFQDAYVNTCWGLVKIKEVKYTYETENPTSVIAIDAQDFIKAILKDAISGEIKLIPKNVNNRS